MLAYPQKSQLSLERLGLPWRPSKPSAKTSGTRRAAVQMNATVCIQGNQESTDARLPSMDATSCRSRCATCCRHRHPPSQGPQWSQLLGNKKKTKNTRGKELQLQPQFFSFGLVATGAAINDYFCSIGYFFD